MFYYRAEFEINVFYNPRKQCTSYDTEYFGSRIDYHFDRYTFYTSKLGPVQVTRNAASCPTNNRRRLLQANNETSYALQPSVPLTAKNTEMASQALAAGNDQHQRKLWGNYNPWWAGLGPCRHCGDDNRDGGRRLNGITPITLTVGTDDYPSEMSLEIQTLDGESVYTHSTFNYARARKPLTVYVTAGQTYKLIMTDSYGDGWCCRYGGGDVYLYEGLAGSGTAFAQFQTEFRLSDTRTFTVPVASTATARSSLEDSSASFMQLASSVSAYVSYFIQKEFQYDSSSCLYKTYPQVTVSLTPATETTSLVCL